MTRWAQVLTVLMVGWVAGATFLYFPTPWIRWEPGWLVTLWVGLTCPFFPGLLYVLLIAWGQEALGMAVHGPLIVSYLAVFFFLRAVRGLVYLETRWAEGVWTFLLTVAQKAIVGSLLMARGEPWVPEPGPMAASALLHAVTAPLFFSWVGRRPRKG